MDKRKKPYRITRERLLAAKKRIDAIPDRGTDEEYYTELIKVYKDYENLRLRTNLSLLFCPCI